MATKESIRAFQQTHPKKYLELERYCDNCYLTRLLHHYGLEEYNCPKENQLFIELHSPTTNSYYTNSNDQIAIKKHFIHKEKVTLLIEVYLERLNAEP